jgi:RNA polymerase sigma-70 factor (sigma-E family)
VSEASVTERGDGVGHWSSDPAGFDLFYGTTRQLVLRTVYLVSGDLGEAQDCVQEAYIRAWQRWTVVSGYAKPEAWVQKVALRLAISHWRKLVTSRKAWGRRGARSAVDGPEANAVAVLTALNELSRKQREAIVLHHLCQFSVKEIAELVGAPEGTVKARLSRGRTAMATMLGEEIRDA